MTRAKALEEELRRTRRVLARAGVALEVLVGSDAQVEIRDISPDLRQALREALLAIRAEIFRP